MDGGRRRWPFAKNGLSLGLKIYWCLAFFGVYMLVVNNSISIPLKEFSFSYARSPGPGGQNVNKVNTKVVLRWSVDESESLPKSVSGRLKSKYPRRIAKTGELIIQSHRFRDQGRNVADVLNKLRELILTVAEEPKARKRSRPTKASKRRRIENKRRNSERKRSRKDVRLDD